MLQTPPRVTRVYTQPVIRRRSGPAESDRLRGAGVTRTFSHTHTHRSPLSNFIPCPGQLLPDLSSLPFFFSLSRALSHSLLHNARVFPAQWLRRDESQLSLSPDRFHNVNINLGAINPLHTITLSLTTPPTPTTTPTTRRERNRQRHPLNR